MTTMPTYYSAAKTALGKAVRFDEVKKIRNQAHAMRVYAIQAKDGELAKMATEIKLRATFRLGEMMEEQRKAGKLAKPTGGKRVKGQRGFKNPDAPKSLAEQGIDKNLAKNARALHRAGEAKLEQQIAKRGRLAAAAAEGNTAMVKAARAEQHAEKKAARAAREAMMASKIIALPNKKYGVVYADPEWKFKTFSVEGTLTRSPEDHYVTSELDVIKARDVPSISAKDCVLFLWATQPMLPHALEVMAAWGFTYKSHAIWNKLKNPRAGTGYWFINKHEVLLLGVRGNVPAPAGGTQWPSVIDAPPSGRHSEKPDLFYKLIESYFPNLPKIELNARKRRKGWDAWGTLEHEPTAQAAE